MEDDEEGAGTAMDLLTAAGNMEVIGNHRIRKATTTAGAKIISHGQRTKRAAAPAEQAPEEPVEEADDEEYQEEEEVTEEEELLLLQNLNILRKAGLIRLQNLSTRSGLISAVHAGCELSGRCLQNLDTRVGLHHAVDAVCAISKKCGLLNLKRDIWKAAHHTVDAICAGTGKCNLQNLGGLRIGKLTARSGSNVTLEGHNSVGEA